MTTKYKRVVHFSDAVNERDELFSEVAQLREALDRSARHAHAIGAPNSVKFEDCKREACVAARAALAGKEKVSGDGMLGRC